MLAIWHKREPQLQEIESKWVTFAIGGTRQWFLAMETPIHIQKHYNLSASVMFIQKIIQKMWVLDVIFKCL